MRTLTTAIVYMMLALCTGTSIAQDRIITMEGEQISCRIIEQDSLNVVYMLHQPGAVSEVMPRYRIFRIDINVPEEIHWVRKYRKAWESSRGNRMKGFRLAAGAGNAALLLPVTGDPSYTGSRTHGFNIKVEGTYFFGRFFGLGARYSMFRLHTLFLHYVSLNPTLRVPIRKGRAALSVRVFRGLPPEGPEQPARHLGLSRHVRRGLRWRVRCAHHPEALYRSVRGVHRGFHRYREDHPFSGTQKCTARICRAWMRPLACLTTSDGMASGLFFRP
jgi:hypothetical protein